MLESKPVFVRNMNSRTWTQIRRGAGSRGLEIGVYIARLQRVHELARQFTAGEITAQDLKTTLEELGMGEVLTPGRV